MIDWLVNRIFMWDTLRHAVFDEVHMYDELGKQIKEYKDEEPTNLAWAEGDKWYGWTYSPIKKRYYFNDVGFYTLMGLWEYQWAKE